MSAGWQNEILNKYPDAKAAEWPVKWHPSVVIQSTRKAGSHAVFTIRNSWDSQWNRAELSRREQQS